MAKEMQWCWQKRIKDVPLASGTHHQHFYLASSSCLMTTSTATMCLVVMSCQEIGLVALMFFFELLFSYVSSQFPSMFFLTNSFIFLSADCHGMTFSDRSFHQDYPLFHYSRTDSLSFSSHFHSLRQKEAERKGIYWRRTTNEDHLLLMWSWHLPSVDDFAAVPQLLHAIGLAPVYHDLQAC